MALTGYKGVGAGPGQMQKGEFDLSKLLLNAAEVAEIMDCSERYSYKIIAELNQELKDKGYIIRRGRIPRKYFYERTGLADQDGDT